MSKEINEQIKKPNKEIYDWINEWLYTNKITNNQRIKKDSLKR